MADGRSVLAAQVARLRALPELVPNAAPDIARALEAELRRQISQGVGPDGKPWLPTKDGRRPLVDAADALRVRVVGNTIVVSLEGHYARHHLGAVRGGVRRQILPSRNMPQAMVDAVKRVVAQHFSDAMEVA